MTDTLSSPSTQQVTICPNPIFIIGSPRSGTTALAYALGTHPDLWYSGEGHMFHVLFGDRRLDEAYEGARTQQRLLEKEGVTREEFLQAAGLGFNALYTEQSAGKRWIEKTPSNTLVVDVLARVFPGASFVHILRDGRSVVHSRTHVHWDDMFQLDFRSACREWRQFAAKAMAFAGEHPDRCLTARNEELVLNPDEGFTHIFHFLDVPYDPAPIDFFRSHRINSSFRHRRGDPPLPGEFLDPWQEWTLEQRQIFLEEAGATMLECGLVSKQELRYLERDRTEAVEPALVSLAALREEYRRSKPRIRRALDHHVPPVAVILVISRGDEELLELEGRIGMHFPQTEEGIYAGEYPADSQEAIDQLEALRARGAGYLLIPAPAFWWLEYYAGFAQHLHSRYHCLWQDEELILYALEPA